MGQGSDGHYNDKKEKKGKVRITQESIVSRETLLMMRTQSIRTSRRDDFLMVTMCIGKMVGWLKLGLHVVEQ